MPVHQLEHFSAKEFLMSGNPKQTFHGITRAIFARLRRKASRFGIRVASPKGEAVKDGVVIQWNYDSIPRGSIGISVTKLKSFFGPPAPPER
jgi:hypothetical protein